MKTGICILLLLPIALYPQQNWYKTSQSDFEWQNVGTPGFSEQGSYYTSLAFSPFDGKPYVAYVDMPVGCGTTGLGNVMRFDGVQWGNVGIPGFTMVTIGYTSLAFSPVDSMPYVAFAAGCSSALQASVMRFDGTNWSYVGNGGFSPGTAAYTSLAFNPADGKPYVAFMDMLDPGRRVSVMKFDGTNWLYVGTPNFSCGQGHFTKLSFSHSGIPYVVFQSIAPPQDVTVMNFNGTDWASVGSPGFISGVTAEVGFGISPTDDQPYVAFDDAQNLHRLKIVKFDGSSWVAVGDPGSPQGWASRICLTFSLSGQLYASYWDSSIPGMCVKTLVGTDWVPVGDMGFTAGTTDYPSFAISPSSVPHLAYMDNGDSGQATVMKFDSPNGFNDNNDQILALYPNPATTFLTIRFGSHDARERILEVFNMEGNVVAVHQTRESLVVLNTEDYSAGIYILKVQTENSFYIKLFCKR
jgi:hypothetical protein